MQRLDKCRLNSSVGHILVSGLFENDSFLLYVIFHNPSTPFSVTICSLECIQIRIFWKSLMLWLFLSRPFVIIADVLLIFVRYEPYWKNPWITLNEWRAFQNPDIPWMMSHISPITRAALRPVTATAVWVLLLSLAAFSQLPQSLESSRSMMMLTDGCW